MAIGEAAGIAASVAVRDRCSLKDIKVNKVQQILRETGAIVSR